MSNFNKLQIVFGVLFNILPPILLLINFDKEKKMISLIISAVIFFLIGVILLTTKNNLLALYFIFGLSLTYGLATIYLWDEPEPDTDEERFISEGVYIAIYIFTFIFILIGSSGSKSNSKSNLKNIKPFTNVEHETYNDCINNFGGPLIVKKLSDELNITNKDMDISEFNIKNLCKEIVLKIRKMKKNSETLKSEDIKQILQNVKDNNLVKELSGLLYMKGS